MGGVLNSILVMACSYSECSVYPLFDVEEGDGVYPTNFVWYSEWTTVESGMIIYNTIKTRFCIVLKYN